MQKNDASGCPWKAAFHAGISRNIIAAKGPFTQTMYTVYLGGETFIVRISKFAVSGRK